MGGYIEFAESRPAEVRAMLAEVPVAYVPFGSLEWHGEHNPLGLDGIKAEELLRRTAAVTGGVLFPTVYWGAFHTLRFPFTFHFPPAVMWRMTRRMLEGLGNDGFRVVVMLTGHYPVTQVLHLHLQARRFNSRRRGGAVAIAFPEMAFAWDMGYYGDHAGHWETSIMMALRPGLVDLYSVPPHAGALERTLRWGVMGRDPGLHSDAELGRRAVERIVSGLAALVAETVRTGSDAAYRRTWREYVRHGALSRRALWEQVRPG